MSNQPEPRLEIRAKQSYVAIPIQVPMKAWSKANALVGEVFAWLGHKGIDPAGPLFYRYHVIGDMEAPFDLEVGIPVRRAVKGDTRVKAGTIPAGTYAVVIHHGHPDQLPHTLEALEVWAANKAVAWDTHQADGRAVWASRVEFYLTNPADQPDLNQWAIEVIYRIKSDLPDGMGRPAHRALLHAGYTQLAQIAQRSEAEIADLHGMGPKALGRIRAAMADQGLAFADA